MHLAPELAAVLRSLLLDRRVASLATLHDGRPFVSMIPFAAAPLNGRLHLVTHVSGLSAHTRDMRAAPEVCVLVTAPESAGVMPQALPRVSMPARATFVSPADPAHAVVKAAYLARFPDAAELFQIGDFSLVTLEPTSARFIAGFARALTLSPATLAAAVTVAADAGD